MSTFEKLMKNNIFIDNAFLAYICEKYFIKSICIFGSSLRDDFNTDSDLDFLVEFVDSAPITLFDIMDLEDELFDKFKRRIDIVEKESLKNPIRKQEILKTSELLYAA